MSAILRFIETAGSDSSLRTASPADMQNALNTSDLDDTARAAIVSGARHDLIRMLGAAPTMVCGVFATEDDDDAQQEEFTAPAISRAA